ncbi:MAG: Sec-independent protein translocase subunit TatA [Candidatus Nanopelagicales bacterium]
MFSNLRGSEWLILILIVVLLFGARRLPDAARGLGRSLRIFKAETKGLTESSSTETAPDATAAKAVDSPPAATDQPTVAEPPAGKQTPTQP